MSWGSEQSAILALVYLKLHKRRYHPIESQFSHDERGFSLASIMAEEQFNDLDWSVVEAIERPGNLRVLTRLLAAVSPVRCEALLHCVDRALVEELADCWWIESFVYEHRWDLVEAEMRQPEWLALVANRAMVDRVFDEAAEQLLPEGASLEDW